MTGSRRLTAHRIALIAALSVGLAGCGGGADDAAAPATDATGASTGSATAGPSAGIGPGLTVSEARTTDADGPLLVRGALLVEGRTARLCERLAESAPPQCGGDALEVEGLDASTIETLQRSGDVQWAEEVKLLGEVQGNRLIVSGSATG